MPDSCPLADYPSVIAWPIQWGDQDLYGHVNNTVYLRWLETGRIAYLELIGFDKWKETRNIGPILAAVHCNYRTQLHYPGAVRIGSRIARIGRTSLTMQHAIWSEQLNSIVADGDSTIVAFDYAKQIPIPVPEEIRAAIAAAEGKPM